MSDLPRNRILVGDALAELQRLPTASVDTVVTSPPYYMVRDYLVAGQLGLEDSVDGWVNSLRAVVAELARVLKPSGSLWLNLADTYSRSPRYGAPAKSLLLAPERLLLALAADGWRVRNKAVWSKPNPLPSPVSDRLNTTYEFVYFLTRSRHYYFDLNAIREPHTSGRGRRGTAPVRQAPAWAGPLAGSQDGLRRTRAAGLPGHPLGKNPGDVWRIPTRGFRGAHYATFPEQLARRPVLATCPERVCQSCGRPWSPASGGSIPTCGCGVGSRPGIVLDPFMGTGTVAVVAQALGRDWLGIELNPDFVRMAYDRMAPVASAPRAA